MAAGLQLGHHQGAIFQDTHLYKWLEAVAFCIGYGAGETFIPIADEVIELMEKAQEPDNCLPATSMSHVKPVRQGWFSCACCPPHIARTLASLGQYIYAQSDDSVYANMFISSRLNTQIGDKAVGVEMQADYMQGGDVTLQVTAPDNAGLTLKVRIPWYLKNPMVNGEKAVTEHGYVTVPVNGDTQVMISGSVKAKFVAANRNVRADVGKAALDLPAWAILKNSCALTFLGLKYTIGIPGITCFVDAAMLFGFPLSLVLLVLGVPTLVQFIVCCLGNIPMQKWIVEPYLRQQEENAGM